ncbi:hypothetical protein RNJ44_00342 [Nakaseomyces bracarensis]|uniref:Uncharacterized protein n=1 Tax=Nakaseomyces bracarensis TaxID=273131 RepID=A0ABR4NSA9_9SACH
MSRLPTKYTHYHERDYRSKMISETIYIRIPDASIAPLHPYNKTRTNTGLTPFLRQTPSHQILSITLVHIQLTFSESQQLLL